MINLNTREPVTKSNNITVLATVSTQLLPVEQEFAA